MANRDATTARESGFTIIEVLIVLAIAGLIITLIFMLIPTLERSGRNNQRKQDVQTILAQISHFELSDSGNIPDTATLQARITSYGKLSYYLATGITVAPSTALGTTNASMPAITDTTKVQIYNHAKCNADTPGNASNAGAGYNDVVALYALESGNTGVSSQCQQL